MRTVTEITNNPGLKYTHIGIDSTGVNYYKEEVNTEFYKHRELLQENIDNKQKVIIKDQIEYKLPEVIKGDTFFNKDYIYDVSVDVKYKNIKVTNEDTGEVKIFETLGIPRKVILNNNILSYDDFIDETASYFNYFIDINTEAVISKRVIESSHSASQSWDSGSKRLPPKKQDPMLFTVDTSISGSLDLFTYPQYNYTGIINWGDGSANTVLSGAGVGTITHTFASAGLTQVRISGTSVPGITIDINSNIVSVENLGTIGWSTLGNTFFGSVGLISFNAGNTDTSNVTNMASMFAECGSLSSFNAGNIDTSNVTNMNAMFQNCNSLTSLNLESFDTSNVQLFNSMFGGCTLLNQLQLPLNFVTANCIRTISTFLNCSSLPSLDVSSWITSNVTSMANMFNGLLAVPDITGIENFDITGINALNGLNSFCRFTQLTTATYNDLLINFEAQYNAAPIPINGLAPYFKATATGAAALAARNSLINNYNWVITDQT
jgi:surface protein